MLILIHGFETLTSPKIASFRVYDYTLGGIVVIDYQQWDRLIDATQIVHCFAVLFALKGYKKISSGKCTRNLRAPK